MKQFIVVSYDISDDKRRLRVMKTLKNFGTHVQYSVFECRLKAAQIAALQERLRPHIGQGDSVRFYYLSADDGPRTEILGAGQVTPDRAYYLHEPLSPMPPGEPGCATAYDPAEKCAGFPAGGSRPAGSASRRALPAAAV